MKRFLFVIFVALVSFSGCSEKENSKKDTGMYMLYKEYLIDSYIAADGLLFAQNQNSPIVKLALTGPEYGIASAEETERMEFRELAARHGDELRREISVEFCYKVGDYKCCAQDFVSVDVRSDTAWDDTHPAGSSLGDLCYLIAYSYAPFIDNDYVGSCCTYLRKKLCELTPDDLRMLEPGNLSLYFEKRPDHSEPQIITITFKTTDGAVVTARGRIQPIE